MLYLKGQINEKKPVPSEIVCWDRLWKSCGATRLGAQRPLNAYRHTLTFDYGESCSVSHTMKAGKAFCSACPQKSIRFHVFRRNLTVCSSLWKKR